MTGRREIALDNNVLVDLLDAGSFSAQELARRLRERGVSIVLPEIVVLQALLHGNPAVCYRRFCNIAELSDCAGFHRFSLAVPIREIFQEELLARPMPRSPIYSCDAHEHIFAHARSHATFLMFLRKMQPRWHHWLDVDGWHEKDLHVRAQATRLIERWSNFRVRALHARRRLRELPGELTVDHFFLTLLIPAEDRRRQIVAAPTRHSSVVALALANDLAALGAQLDLGGDAELDHLRIERDAWTDARVLAASVHAQVLATNDQRLTRRAELMRSWGLFAPRVLAAHHVLPSAGA